MKIKLLIGTDDEKYVQRLSGTLSSCHGDVFEVSLCTTPEKMTVLLEKSTMHVALIAPEFVPYVPQDARALVLVLCSEADGVIPLGVQHKCVEKYQRISSIASEVLGSYAAVSTSGSVAHSEGGKVTVAWSPCGGVGKTTAALAYATNRVTDNYRVTYLNMEDFCSTAAFFAQSGKSISNVFEQLDNTNVPMLLQSIRQKDSGSGIFYFSQPENYDDMNALTDTDIQIILDGCLNDTNEIVVDLSNGTTGRTGYLLEQADTILLVCDDTPVSHIKLQQFIQQHNLWQLIADHCVLVWNKGAQPTVTEVEKTVSLPRLKEGNPVAVYKTLSSNSFGW